MSTTVVLPREQFEQLLDRRRESAGALYDEVWEGVYVMSPDPNVEHQELSTLLTVALHSATRPSGARIVQGVDISDLDTDWRRNYRCPDLSIFMPGNRAEDRGSHFFGGPDFAVEIVCPEDRSREKLDFYKRVGVREALYIDRRPWTLELFRDDGEKLVTAGRVHPGDEAPLRSEVLGVLFRLLPGEPRPRIEVTRDEGGWIV